MTFHIVGIDPSLSATGLAVIRVFGDGRETTIECQSIESKSIPNAGYPETLGRLRALAARILRAAKAGAEEGDGFVIVMEGPVFGQATGQYHTRAGLFWLLYHLLEKIGFLVIVEPTKLKRYVTGKGNAKKDLVFGDVIRNYGALVLDNNQADALGLAAMAARELGSPVEKSVHKVTPAALEGVRWPEFMQQMRERKL
jgi:Holliday junction resolvasome RuvABC endonuclease subunit